MLGCPASRRHGLLSAPALGTGVPHLFLARLEEWVLEGERALPISSARYPGALHPGGHAYLASFDAWPWPRWVYRVGDVEVVREVRLPPPQRAGHTVLVRWTVKGPRVPARALTVRPLLACREAGALTSENAHVRRRADPVDGGVVVQPYPALPPLSLTLSGAPSTFEEGPDWYRRIEYATDLAAGLPAHEDHYTPGLFRIAVGARAEVVLAATTGPAVADPRALWRSLARGLGGRLPPRATLAACLSRAADDHLVRRDGVLTVIDRLPEGGSSPAAAWDALPGLLLPRSGLAELGEALLQGAPAVVGGAALGVAPGWAALGADRAAALAWARAAGLYLDARGRSARLAKALETALFALGARLRTEAQGDPEAGGCGLLSGAAEPGERRLDVVVNARWCALASRLASRSRGSGGAGGAARRGWSPSARTLAQAFHARFVLEEEGHLADVWLDGAPDRRLGPGMVAAAAEARAPLTREQRLAVVARARAELLTPRGLRRRSPRDPSYRPAGVVEARWIGPFVEASLLAEGRRPPVLARLTALVEGFAPHLSERGLGHVSERFGGEAPYAPAGAPSEARAVAGLLWASHLLGLATR